MKRKGIGILYAILVMMAIAGIATYSLSMSAQSSRITVDEHVKIQLQLYKKSAVELGLLWLSADQSRSNPASDYSDYNVTFDSNYAFQLRFWKTSVQHIPESNGTVIMDITGETNLLDEPIRITERMILKP